MAKQNKEVEVVEVEETDEASFPTTPKALATELGINAKSLRAFLRAEFTRPLDEKNTSWVLTLEMVEAARDHFLGDDEEESDEEVDTDVVDELDDLIADEA